MYYGFSDKTHQTVEHKFQWCFSWDTIGNEIFVRINCNTEIQTVRHREKNL